MGLCAIDTVTLVLVLQTHTDTIFTFIHSGETVAPLMIYVVGQAYAWLLGLLLSETFGPLKERSFDMKINIEESVQCVDGEHDPRGAVDQVRLLYHILLSCPFDGKRTDDVRASSSLSLPSRNAHPTCVIYLVSPSPTPSSSSPLSTWPLFALPSSLQSPQRWRQQCNSPSSLHRCHSTQHPTGSAPSAKC
jgi:hypothetical protein